MVEICVISSECINKYNDSGRPEVGEKIIQIIMVQMAKGMEYLHKSNIIHRDIKLNNILLNFPDYKGLGAVSDDYLFDFDPEYDNVQVVICDFGLSKEMESCDYTRTVVGTPYTMAPEVLSNEYYNNQVDIWSLGVILYELFTGDHPFVGQTRQRLIENIKAGKFSFSETRVFSESAKNFIKR
jgi:serine/threonine protein kinase